MSNLKIFTDCRIEGEKAEQLVCDILNRADIQASRDKTAGYKWDIILEHEGKKAGVEVKFDKYEKKTGNIAIEVFNSRQNKKSGLSSTLAKFWVCVLSNGEVWITLSELLKKYTKENEPLFKSYNSGDGNANILLYKKRDIMKKFFRIDNVDKYELQEIIKRGMSVE